jgi:hypothetical protein
MSEDYLSRDQHRADLAELRLEISGQLASLDKRTELIAQDLVSRTDRLAQDLGALRRETGEWRDSLRGDLTALRTDLRGDMTTLRADMRSDMRELRDEMRQFRTTTQRQLWVMVSVMSTAVIGALVKLVFFP